MSNTLLTYENIVNRLMNILDIETKEEFVDRVNSGEYTIHLYQGLKFIGNTESQFGIGYLYATSGYGTHSKKPRYDYIMVKVRDSNKNEYDQAAQLLAIFNIKYNNVQDNQQNNKIFLMIAYLQQIISNLPDMPFPMVTWELTKINNEFLPNIDYIDTNALQGPAYIVPTYRSKNHIVSNNILDFKKDCFFYCRETFLIVMAGLK